MKIRQVAIVLVLGLSLSGCSGGTSSEDAIDQLNADSAKIAQDNLMQNDLFASEVVLAGFSDDRQAMYDLASDIQLEAASFLTQEVKAKLREWARIQDPTQLKEAAFAVGLGSQRGLQFLQNVDLQRQILQTAVSIGNIGTLDAKQTGYLLGQLAGITKATQDTTIESLSDQLLEIGTLKGLNFEFNEQGQLTEESFELILTTVSVAAPPLN